MLSAAFGAVGCMSEVKDRNRINGVSGHTQGLRM